MNSRRRRTDQQRRLALQGRIWLLEDSLGIERSASWWTEAMRLPGEQVLAAMPVGLAFIPPVYLSERPSAYPSMSLAGDDALRCTSVGIHLTRPQTTFGAPET